ncbi:hypothetical protein V8D89_003141 [Ganoderma adspersum]
MFHVDCDSTLHCHSSYMRTQSIYLPTPAENHKLEEWIPSIAGILPQGWNDQFASAQSPRHHEFPTGYNNYFTGMDRYSCFRNWCPRALCARKNNKMQKFMTSGPDTRSAWK